MTILVDDLSSGYCHLWDSEDDFDALDAFVVRMGLQTNWCHIRTMDGGFELYHYRLTERNRERAIAFGAQPASLRDWIRWKLAEESG